MRMMKKGLTIIMAFFLSLGISAQQNIESETISHLRGCRMGTPNPQFKPRRAQLLQGGENPYIGNRHQLVVLASFKDQDFAEDHEGALQKWNKIFNAENYTEDRFKGSVHDYFMAQSYGQFNLTFDLLFVELPDKRTKYRSTYMHDEYSQYMVDDIVDELLTKDIDWSIYDWDGDSFVDQLLIIYAGKGMNADGGSNSIWPHQWWLSQHLNMETDEPQDHRGFRTVMHGEKEYYVDCYCCMQEEVNTFSVKTSFGTICHEYSHCFGFPDYYYNGGVQVVGEWDLMDFGNYSGQGFLPCNYSAHERMLMGWLTPVELTSTTTVTNMPALIDEPVAYLIRNDGAENEFYIVENRQQKGWDGELPGSGILVFHIDYDKDLWVSTKASINGAARKRYRIIPANNDPGISEIGNWAYPYVMQDVLGNDSIANDSLTNTSKPAATLNNQNTEGELLMSKPITSMAVDANGVASFIFMDNTVTSIREVPFSQEQDHDAPIYDLQGRRLSSPLKGLYIQGKRLMIMK